jgi:pyruvate decarboxylase
VLYPSTRLTQPRFYCRKWTKLLEALGGTEGKTCQSYTVKTKQELSDLLDNEEFAKADKIQLVEIIMEIHDAPRALKVQAELSGKTNKYVAMGIKTAD